PDERGARLRGLHIGAAARNAWRSCLRSGAIPLLDGPPKGACSCADAPLVYCPVGNLTTIILHVCRENPHMRAAVRTVTMLSMPDYKIKKAPALQGSRADQFRTACPLPVMQFLMTCRSSRA